MRRAAVALLGAVAVLAAGTGVASAEGERRQTIDFQFAGQSAPASSAGLLLRIDYVNTEDADAKPRAVQTVVERLPDGSRIDTSVPERCSASDVALIVQGAAACPPGSRVGGGTVTLDAGLPGLRTIPQKVTQFNNEDELILLFEGEGLPTRAVSRAPIEGNTITAGAPPLPGGPPDGFTAIKSVDLVLEAVSAGGRHYITTPDTCPASGAWTSEISFTYRDGETQVEQDSSPCQEPGAPEVRLSRRCLDDGDLRMALTGEAAAVRDVNFKLDKRLVRRDTEAPFEQVLDRRTLTRMSDRTLRAVAYVRDGDPFRVILRRSLPSCGVG